MFEGVVSSRRARKTSRTPRIEWIMARNPNNRLERCELGIIRAMMATPPRRNDQDILAYFSRPFRSINYGWIKDRA